MKGKYKGIPDIGIGAQVVYIKPDPKLKKGKSKYKCDYYDEESKRCSALHYIECVGVNHSMCKYAEGNKVTNKNEKPIPSGVVNNGTTVTLKEIHTGKEITIKVDSHKNPEHAKLLGKKLKTNAIVENWQGHTYLVYKIKN